ncbi:hypothetical protein DFA_03809 [Cavenderia fasciculata]|uniref:EF-hand domain-containing protein n=1 Tax=Cavenderia fasciculata TaxID=261658 RepID=F4Q0G4_CACFS|nr:uncharacterized protein DFA_03809 [Cavenderia fasciculata]EGG18315.1 hypothetical protein DFA_03809 [Cavenderia fasciculata]|eukprot:XP_004357138.1 hypothetical protein DFA_03809 [Cavenderia fasciculata]
MGRTTKWYNETEVADAFKRFDKDKDGFITRFDLLQIMNSFPEMSEASKKCINYEILELPERVSLSKFIDVADDECETPYPGLLELIKMMVRK